jgi:hypothetical protein
VVTVDFATVDDSAKAGEDYEFASGTLIFQPQIGSNPGTQTGNAGLTMTHVDNNLLLSWPRALQGYILQQRDNFDCNTLWENVSDKPEETPTEFRMLRPIEGASRFFRIIPDTGFTPAETAKRITVKIKGDQIFELDEFFFVDLTNAVNATISRSRGIGTIVNDDVPILSLRRSGEKWILSWPSIAQKYVLQSRSELSESSDWTDVATLPIVVGTEFQVQEENAAKKFYRLVRPRPPKP